MKWEEMGDELDYIMRPVLEGLCHYESLKDCTLDLTDIATMNEALDVRAENERRYRKANQE